MTDFLHEFHEDKNGGPPIDNGYWEIDYDLNKLINYMGGWHSYHSPREELGEEILYDIEWEDVMSKMLRKENSPYGWIDLNGVFCGCKEYDHDKYAQWIFNCREWELDEIGYVKVLRSPITGEIAWMRGDLHEPNAAQTDRLEKLGILEDRL